MESEADQIVDDARDDDEEGRYELREIEVVELPAPTANAIPRVARPARGASARKGSHGFEWHGSPPLVPAA